MIFTNYPITLDVHSVLSQVSIPVPQGDTARRLSITLSEEGKPISIPDGCIAVFTGTKADGTPLDNHCIIENNTLIRYDFTEQTTAVIGKVDCAVRVYGVGGRILYGPRMTLVVYEAPGGDGTPSEPEMNVLDSIMQAEVLRAAAEQERIEAEQERVEAEQERVEAEQKREEVMEDLLAKSEIFEKDLSTITDTPTLFYDAKNQAVKQLGDDLCPESHTMEVRSDVNNIHLVKIDATKYTLRAQELQGRWVLIGDLRGYIGSNTSDTLTIYTDETKTTPLFMTVAAGTTIYPVDEDVTEELKELLGGGLAGVELAQTAGNSETAIMSQKAVTEYVQKYAGSGGGGGGGSITVTNQSGWLSKSIAEGSACAITLTWSSTEEGNGVLKVSANGVAKTAREVSQGTVSIEVGSYLSKGINEVAVTIADVYGSSRTITFTITTVSVNISSYFDDATAYTGEIPFSYTPVGAVDKTVHFLVDGSEVGKAEGVSANNREQTYTLPAQSHGSHTLEVYFTATIDEQPVESNHLIYDLICYVEGNSTPIIASSFSGESFKQHATVVIPYIVYTPGALTSAIQLKDGGTVVSELTVDRTRQTWAYKASTAGSKSLSIVCGDTVKPFTFTVTESDVLAEAETSNLELFLSANGRSNNEANPLTWGYNGVSAELTGFNLKSDGWKSDADGNTVLRVSGDARVAIPFNLFGSDFKTTGKTIEIELATRDVRNYDAVVLSCFSGERGIQITAQKAMLKSEQSEVFTQYKEDEHIRVAFCVEKSAENRLLAIYINGIMSGVVQYPSGDDFEQLSPVGISIGSSECTVDIYCIRVYSNNLSRYQLVNNWIADTQDVEVMTDRYVRNDVFDDYGNISVAKLPTHIPYVVFNSATYEDLPQFKGDKKTVSGTYIDPLHPERSFTFEDAELDVQGTSSQYYARKNYLLVFANGLVVNGVAQTAYQLRPTSMPTDTFCFKADVASSEGANNVELVMFYEDTCPVNTPPQEADSRVRQGIEGYPCLAFYYDGKDYHFIGKYNFNNDKATPEVFGFEEGDESWEILQNNTEMAMWKDDNFEGDGWKATFEGRYPKKSTDTENLAALAAWLKSTDTTAVSTEAEKAERVEKFKSEFADWFNKDAMIFNYLFTELFLMVDNRAKNAFPTRYDEDGKWLVLPYDYDTAIGINNNGKLTFGYELEDTDIVDGKVVFNGQESVLYVNIRLAFADEIKAMYQELRTKNIFSYEEIEKRFEAHQSVWGESIFNEDARFKYIEPLVNDGDSSYLPMLQGAKAEQRKWWLYNRFRYLDSKYEAGDSMSDTIQLYAYAVANLTLTPYADIYAAAKFADTVVKERALRANGSCTLVNPLSGGNDMVIGIYSASQLASLGDLSGLKVGRADFHNATKLSSLKVGSSTSGYTNPNLTDLTIGNLTLLKELDVRNCTALAQAVDLSGCTNIEKVYFEGTAITGVKLPVGGILKTLHLPATVTSLVIQNHSQLTDFSMPSYANISTLRLECVSQEAVDAPAILAALPENSRVRLIDIDWTVDTVEDIYALYDKLDTCRGLDENGNNADKAVITGTIHVDMASETDLAEFASRYPTVTIEPTKVVALIQFIDGDTVVSRQLLSVGERITVPEDPTKEATEQFSYTFNGWGYDSENIVVLPSTANGSDLTFYAVWTANLQYYTVRFLNGETVMQTESLGYGELPVYTGDAPQYTGTDGFYDFTGWAPEVVPVTGAIDYTAQFVLRPNLLATYSWDEISAISAAGTAENYFRIGDTKGIILSGTIGTLEVNQVYYLYIIGFDHNEALEGRGIHFGMFKSGEFNGDDVVLQDSYFDTATGRNTSLKSFAMNYYDSNMGYNAGGWAGCDMRHAILGSVDVKGAQNAGDSTAINPVENTLMAALPADLRAVMKPMTKYTDNVGNSAEGLEANVTATIDYLPLLSPVEIVGTGPTYELNRQEQYEYYVENSGIRTIKHTWLRSPSCSATWGYFYSTYTNKNVYTRLSYYSQGVSAILKV